MKVTVSGGKTLPKGPDALVIPVYEGGNGAELDPAWSKILPRRLNAVLESHDLRGKRESSYIVYPPGNKPAKRILLMGAGPRSSLDLEGFRRFGGAVAAAVTRLEGKRAVVLLPTVAEELDLEDRVQAISEGIELGAYTFRRYKSDSTGEGSPRRCISAVTLQLLDSSGLTPARRAARRGSTIAYGVNLCRDLGNMPGNELGPVELAEIAEEEGATSGLTVRCLDEPALVAEGMGGLLGVARGSERPARLIVLEYSAGGGPIEKPIIFVGKAITFDSGGISIKPAKNMQELKYDMSGGGAVLGAMVAIGRLRPKRSAVGIIASAENMPSGTAIRPGDVLESSSGIRIEVVNTDAEGRLVLADALHYAKRYRPEAVIDLATLTGACVVALGSVRAGLFSRHLALVRDVQLAAERAGEKLWHLPLDDEYFDQIKSDIADVKNSGGRPAGAVTAAAFLARFIAGHPWAHLDIAGVATADRERDYQRKGATGWGVRTLVELAGSE